MLNKRSLREFFAITIGTIITACAVFFFMMPSHVTVGSAAGLALVISEFVPLSVSAITMIMNVGLLIIGFLLIGPEFGAKTVYCAVLLPAVIGVFEWIFPNFQSLTGDPLIDAALENETVTLERRTDGFEVSCPFDPTAPSPLAFALTACTVINARAVLRLGREHRKSCTGSCRTLNEEKKEDCS